MTFWADRPVLVTGGSGFIGSHLVEALLNVDARVRVAGRNRAKFQSVLGRTAERVECLEGDLASPEFARLACMDMDAVFNLAAQVAGVGHNSAHPGTIFTSNMARGRRCTHERGSFSCGQLGVRLPSSRYGADA